MRWLPSSPARRVAPLLAALALTACATIQRAPFTEAQQDVAVIPGMPEVRFWADAPDAAERMAPPRSEQGVGAPVTMLALSGGADEGAYGAGLLNGWSASGKRPIFSIVTGVSTGALIAPLAFLGASEDAALTRLYTTIRAGDIFHMRFPLAIPGSTSAASTKPLARLIDATVTDALVDAVAREHRAGRRLFVGTTNLDAQRMVIWDMGALAASPAPARYRLFRQVLLASSAIPAVFPPVVIDAQSGGHPIRELHVDGGTTAQFLSVPRQLIVDPRPAPDSGRLTVYLIINNRLGGDFQLVAPKTIPIFRRAFTLNQQSALMSLASVSYLYARDHGIDFNLSFIGNELPASNTLFDTAYMQKLYRYGYDRGHRGDFWQKSPPDAAQQAGSARQ